MIGHEIRHHLAVLYGAGIALLIVVLLTPAVGGMARLQRQEDAGTPESVCEESLVGWVERSTTHRSGRFSVGCAALHPFASG